MAEMSVRLAVQRADELKAAHTFKGELDEESRKAMFPQSERQIA